MSLTPIHIIFPILKRDNYGSTMCPSNFIHFPFRIVEGKLNPLYKIMKYEHIGFFSLKTTFIFCSGCIFREVNLKSLKKKFAGWVGGGGPLVVPPILDLLKVKLVGKIDYREGAGPAGGPYYDFNLL